MELMPPCACATTAREFPAKQCRNCSNDFIGPTKRARARWEIRGLAWPSARRLSTLTADRFASKVLPARAQNLWSSCRCNSWSLIFPRQPQLHVVLRLDWIFCGHENQWHRFVFRRCVDHGWRNTPRGRSVARFLVHEFFRAVREDL